MNLKQLQQQSEELKLLDIPNMTPEELEKLVEKLTAMMDESELLISEAESTLKEIEKDKNNENEDI